MPQLRKKIYEEFLEKKLNKIKQLKCNNAFVLLKGGNF